MRHFSILLLITFNFACQIQRTEDHLFQIVENNKFGFINSSGKVVIKPIYRSVGEFSEGFAPARINGSYGYIDETGKFIIEPQFDYATPFSDGLAIVYNDAKPYFINKKGQPTFISEFPVIGNFENGRAQVQTLTGKTGFINKKGALFIDTVFHSIRSFINGFAVVEGLHHELYSESNLGIKKNLEIGVIDTLGRFVLPYGKYEEILDFENGYFRVETPAEPWDTIEGDTRQTAFVNTNGEIILARDHKNNISLGDNISCGLAKTNLYKYWEPEEEGTSYTSEKAYGGYTNLKGDITINDTNHTYVEDFSDNRAFVKTIDRKIFFIDRLGKTASLDTFSEIIGYGFKDGVAFVKKGEKYGMIDTNGTFLIKPQFEDIDNAGIVDGYFFFTETSKDKDGSNRLNGIAKKDGRIILKAIMQDFDRGGFKGGLLKCIINDKFTYVNKKGGIVWQASDNKIKQFENLNIDFMNRAHFCAYPLPKNGDYGGGWYESANTPLKISKGDAFEVNRLNVVVRPEIKSMTLNEGNGISVFISNASIYTVEFNAQDSRLYMKVQAINSKGEWKDIEYLPSSWCGNSYHILTLEPNYFWTFSTPVYEGDFKTKLRIQLKYIDPSDKSENNWKKRELTIYSNEYEGSVNPGQFWRKRDYYPGGLMDPYND